MARVSGYIACLFIGILIGSQAARWWPPLAPNALPLAVGAAIGGLLMLAARLPSRTHAEPPATPHAQPAPETLAEKRVSMEHARYRAQVARTPESEASKEG